MRTVKIILFSFMSVAMMVAVGLAVLPSAVFAAGTAYYVDAVNGLDSNSGTSTGSAWKTISKVNGRTFVPGDSINFKGGQTISGNLILKNSGSSGNVITITSYGTGKTKINAGNGTAISVRNAGYVTVSNIEVFGNGSSTNAGNGVEFLTTTSGTTKFTDITVDNVIAHGFGITKDGEGNGIIVNSNIAGTASSGFKNISITNVDVYNNDYHGIEIHISGYSNKIPHSNLFINNCQSHNNDGKSSYTAHWTGGGIQIGGVEGGTVQNCTVYSNGSNNNPQSIGGPCGILVWNSNNVIVRDSEVYDQADPSGADGGGTDIDSGSNNVFDNVYTHDNLGPGGMINSDSADGGIYRNCTSVNDDTGGHYGSFLMATGPGGVTSNSQFINNYIYSSGTSPALKVETSGITNFIISGNTFETAGDSYLINQDYDSSEVHYYNNTFIANNGFYVWYNGEAYYDQSSWEAATGQNGNG